MTNILGISAFYHDSAAALLQDGDIAAAAQEERFSRRKHDPGFPTLAIASCLRQAGLEIGDIDHVTFYERPMVKFERLMETYLDYAPAGYDSFQQAAPLWAREKLHLPERVLGELGAAFRGTLRFADHHESHAASAFFPSPFADAALLTLDAVGEWSTSTIGLGANNRIELMHEQRFPHSLGLLYSAFTFYTGFKVNSGEYKLMGLAPYGTPRFADLIRDRIVAINDDGSIRLDMSYFNYCEGLTMTSDRFHDLFGGPPRLPESVITQKDMDLAASIQVICEEVVLKAARYARRVTGSRHLAMAGGVALNCVANGRVLREGIFDSMWVQPAAGDAGGALGAALLTWHHHLNRPRTVRVPDAQHGSLLGPRFDNEAVRLFLDSEGAVYESIDDEDELLDRVARLLEEGNIIGWFQGRMEFGPRALGSRSIIGDARSPEMQQKMNLKIKYRESFRPFAPCVLLEHAAEVFELRPADESPYMLQVAPVREPLRTSLTPEDRRRMQDPDLRVRVSVPRSTLPAITHVDYSARIQTVDAERHGRYYRLMRRMYERTGCPVIVNTSFNIRGEPIVGNPDDALRCFLATEMDVLVLEDCLLLKQRQDPASLASAEAYKALYALD
jgi:carbamoyltransferase